MEAGLKLSHNDYIVAIVIGFPLSIGKSTCRRQPRYDLLFKGGHVIDPANHIDEVRDVAVSGEDCRCRERYSGRSGRKSRRRLESVRHARTNRHSLPHRPRGCAAGLVYSGSARTRLYPWAFLPTWLWNPESQPSLMRARPGAETFFRKKKKSSIDPSCACLPFSISSETEWEAGSSRRG